MKTALAITRLTSLIFQSSVCVRLVLAASIVVFAAEIPAASETAETFASAEDAAQALASAAKTKDRAALTTILGPASEELQVSDTVQADTELTDFAEAYDRQHKIIPESDTRANLEVGTSGWELPIPLVKAGGRWTFDTADGVEEIINRRVGRNELSALATVRAYVDAQRDYAAHDRDGSGVLKYAQKIKSTPGKKDGLYWPMGEDGEMSPFGPLVAEAQIEGYLTSTSTSTNSGPKPFHGYCYKILTQQGSHAPGGKDDYVINGNMIAGFGLVAWPADYGDSGVMTFVVNQQGRVYQKDLGSNTVSFARAMKEYDPDQTWTLSPE